MAPRPSPYTSSNPQLAALIASTSYGPLPPQSELESLHSALQSHAQSLQARIAQGEVAVQAVEREKLKRAAVSPVRVLKKEQRTASPNPSDASTSAVGQINALRQAGVHVGDGQVKKKKLKRVLDSDDETHGPPQQRPRVDNISPQASTSGLKLKLSSQPAYNPVPTHSSVDFTLPNPPLRQLIPPRPISHKPPKPGPKRQADVDEDYSNVKVSGQVNFQTFWQGVEPYLREVREDDLAMLGFTADAPELFEVPARGRHYQDGWDEEDGLPPGTTPHHPISASPKGGRIPPHLPHFVPANDMKDEALSHERGLGVMTERIVAAVQAEGHPVIREGVPAEVREREKGEKLDVAKIDVVELEERMKRELRAVMLLGEHEEFDPSSREDDEITSALRQCQRQLKTQSAINTSRKTKLAEVARARLAYSEYSSALEGIEKAIESAWLKRSKSSSSKKPSSHETRSRQPIADNVKKLLAIRAKWKQNIGKSFDELEEGVVLGLPTKSIYEGIGDTEKKG